MDWRVPGMPLRKAHGTGDPELHGRSAPFHADRGHVGRPPAQSGDLGPRVSGRGCAESSEPPVPLMRFRAAPFPVSDPCPRLTGINARPGGRG